VEFLKHRWDEAVDHGQPDWLRTHETGILEDPQVLGDRGLRERQLGEDLMPSTFGLSSQKMHDSNPRWMGERFSH
jgi:hypothetical protein